MPLAFLITSNENNLLITKHHINKKNKKKLTVSEIFSSNVALATASETFESNGAYIEIVSDDEEEPGVPLPPAAPPVGRTIGGRGINAVSADISSYDG